MKMAEFNVLPVYMLLILVISLFGSTSRAGPAQHDETMTIVLDSNDYPRNEMKYIHYNVELTDSPNVGPSIDLVKNDSLGTSPERNTMSSATEIPYEPTMDDQATKSTTKTMTTNTRTTSSMTNSTTVTSVTTPTSMSSTTTSSVTISTTSTMSGTRN